MYFANLGRGGLKGGGAPLGLATEFASVSISAVFSTLGRTMNFVSCLILAPSAD